VENVNTGSGIGSATRVGDADSMRMDAVRHNGGRVGMAACAVRRERMGMVGADAARVTTVAVVHVVAASGKRMAMRASVARLAGHRNLRRHTVNIDRAASTAERAALAAHRMVMVAHAIGGARMDVAGRLAARREPVGMVVTYGASGARMLVVRHGADTGTTVRMAGRVGRSRRVRVADDRAVVVGRQREARAARAQHLACRNVRKVEGRGAVARAVGGADGRKQLGVRRAAHRSAVGGQRTHRGSCTSELHELARLERADGVALQILGDGVRDVGRRDQTVVGRHRLHFGLAGNLEHQRLPLRRTRGVRCVGVIIDQRHVRSERHRSAIIRTETHHVARHIRERRAAIIRSADELRCAVFLILLDGLCGDEKQIVHRPTINGFRQRVGGLVALVVHAPTLIKRDLAGRVQRVGDRRLIASKPKGSEKIFLTHWLCPLLSVFGESAVIKVLVELSETEHRPGDDVVLDAHAGRAW